MKEASREACSASTARLLSLFVTLSPQRGHNRGDLGVADDRRGQRKLGALRGDAARFVQTVQLHHRLGEILLRQAIEPAHVGLAELVLVRLAVVVLDRVDLLGGEVLVDRRVADLVRDVVVTRGDLLREGHLHVPVDFATGKRRGRELPVVLQAFSLEFNAGSLQFAAFLNVAQTPRQFHFFLAQLALGLLAFGVR